MTLLTCVIDFPFALMRLSNTDFLALLFSDCSVRDAQVQTSWDTTPCKVTPIVLHGVVLWSFTRKPGPASGPGCLVYAEFARQRKRLSNRLPRPGKPGEGATLQVFQTVT